MAKLHYYRHFRSDPYIRNHLPQTAICTRATLKSYLDQYNTVYVKPNVGGRGEGVVKVWKEDGQYKFVIEKGTVIHCSSAREVYQKLGLARKKRHVVQRGITLKTYKGRSFDVRIMMMRDAKRSWKKVGILAKVAGKRSVITNVNRGGGYAMKIEAALDPYSSNKKAKMIQEMIKLAYRCNKSFNRIRYEWQMGYDIGVDQAGKIWLIEANPGNPSHALFAKLKDKSMYREIKRAASAYRRRKA